MPPAAAATATRSVLCGVPDSPNYKQGSLSKVTGNLGFSTWPGEELLMAMLWPAQRRRLTTKLGPGPPGHAPVWFTRPQLGARGPGPGARAAALKLEFESWQSCVACDRPAAGASLQVATVTGSIAEAANRGPMTSSRVHTRARAHTHMGRFKVPACQDASLGPSSAPLIS
jgi:hypothetical protein